MILQSDQLNTVQTIVRWLKNVSAFLWLVALALAALAVYLAHGDRRWAVRLCGFGLIGVGIVLIIGRHVAGKLIVNGLAAYPNARMAAGSAWTIVTERLADANVTILVVGVLVVLWAWTSGVGPRAVALRRHLAPVGRDHAGRLWIGFVAVIALILLWGPTLATRQLIPVVVLTALAAIGLEVLRRQSIAEFPEAALTQWRPSMRLPSRDHTGRLQRLADLHERGALTDAEFEAAKADLLGDPKQ